jgi:phosphinothricin acetyltransferase
LEILKQQGFHRAFAGITLPNDASIALHRACGFELVGVYKEVGRKFGRWLDVAWWQRGLERTIE